MNKKVVAVFLLISTLFTLSGCREDTDLNIELHEFNQVNTSGGSVLYGAGPYSYTVTDCDEILGVFSLLKESGSLNRYTYYFNNLDDEITVGYNLNSFTLKNKALDEIEDGREFVICSGMVKLSTTLRFDNSVCSIGSDKGYSEHTSRLSLIFDETQPEPPRIEDNSFLSYRETDLFEITYDHYYYEILYGDVILFYLSSCRELSDDLFERLIVNSLVQYDVRENNA